MEKASPYAKGNDWENAAHNLAVAAERAGKLDIALDLGEKSLRRIWK